MTTRLFATFPLALGHELHLELGRMRAIILALLATLCVALVATSAVRIDRPQAASTPEPAAEASKEHRAAPAAAVRAVPDPAAGRQALREIDALAMLVAKRYRISAEATRALVATAYREGLRIGVDPLLIIAVIAVESRFNPIAQSNMGAQGLMQVIPAYHKDHMDAVGVDSVLDPHDNIRLGTRILKEYIRRGGTEVAGLQRYNGSADDTTTAYAAKVLGEKQRLQQAVLRARDRA